MEILLEGDVTTLLMWWSLQKRKEDTLFGFFHSIPRCILQYACLWVQDVPVLMWPNHVQQPINLNQPNPTLTGRRSPAKRSLCSYQVCSYQVRVLKKVNNVCTKQHVFWPSAALPGNVSSAMHKSRLYFFLRPFEPCSPRMYIIYNIYIYIIYIYIYILILNYIYYIIYINTYK